MPRRPTNEEIELALKLVGPDFPEQGTLKRQLENSTVTELEDGLVLEFNVLADLPLVTTRSALGEGSLYDVDGVPVIFTLIQKNGYVWHLDIGRADAGRIRRQFDFAQVVALGFGKGLSLERTEQNKFE